jgi:hypothetical protein
MDEIFFPIYMCYTATYILNLTHIAPKLWGTHRCGVPLCTVVDYDLGRHHPELVFTHDAA